MPTAVPAKLECDGPRRMGYAEALRRQEQLVERVCAADAERAHLLLVEHDPPVITLGRRADRRNIVASPERLRREGVEVHEISRGGDVTYHGPGQLVGYPIIRLDLHGRDLRGYLRDLEDVLIRALRSFGVEGRRVDGLTGVWVGEEKVAAIGVAVRRWVTWHGFALNVCPNLEHFSLIVPCGIRDRRVTSLRRLLGRDVSVDEAAEPVARSFREVFGLRAEETP